MTTTIEAQIREKLFSMQDIKYQQFNSKLIPNIDPVTIIGVRTPVLRKLARELAATDTAAQFLKLLPHYYYEENNLHGMLISGFKDYTQTVSALVDFLPHIDNWATCDLLRPKAFAKHPPQLIEQIQQWLASAHPYTVRFAIGMLMSYYLDDYFSEAYPAMVAKVNATDYYVKMMIAWYFATALAKQYDTILPYLEQQRLDLWVHNKAIQKSLESYRINATQKAYLRTLKQKNTQ